MLGSLPELGLVEGQVCVLLPSLGVSSSERGGAELVILTWPNMPQQTGGGGGGSGLAVESYDGGFPFQKGFQLAYFTSLSLA